MMAREKRKRLFMPEGPMPLGNKRVAFPAPTNLPKVGNIFFPATPLPKKKLPFF